MASVSADPWSPYWLRPSCGFGGYPSADRPDAAARHLYDQVQVVARALDEDPHWRTWWTSSAGVAALEMPFLICGPRRHLETIHLEATKGERLHRVEVTVAGPSVDAEDHEALRNIALTHVIAGLTHAAEAFRLEPLPALPALPPPAPLA